MNVLNNVLDERNTRGWERLQEVQIQHKIELYIYRQSNISSGF